MPRPITFYIFAFIFGAVVGSFLNVCICRLPKGESIVFPPSHCPACGFTLPFYDNIPLISWLILRGQCRSCRGPISFRYPLVELISALLTLFLFKRFGLSLPFGILFIFCSAMVVITFIDLDHMIIPDTFTVGLGIAGLVLSFLVPALHGENSGLFMVDSARSGVAALQGMFVGSGLVLWIALVAEAVLKKEAMGFGDVKLVGASGAFTGWQGAVTAVFGGAIVGTLWFVGALLWKKLAGKSAPLAMKAETPDGQPAELGFGVQVPYGPMLAIAGAMHFLWLHRWVSAYFDGLRVVLG